jgi:hypothetical protein
MQGLSASHRRTDVPGQPPVIVSHLPRSTLRCQRGHLRRVHTRSAADGNKITRRTMGPTLHTRSELPSGEGLGPTEDPSVKVTGGVVAGSRT